MHGATEIQRRTYPKCNLIVWSMRSGRWVFELLPYGMVFWDAKEAQLVGDGIGGKGTGMIVIPLVKNGSS